MKGIILAGGKGTRLLPLTQVINKHLLPVYDKPMIYYPIQTLKELGIKEVLITTGGDHFGQISQLLGDGSQFEMNFSYRVQTKPGGIAEAIKLAEKFVGNEKFVVILGDNIFNGIFPKIQENDKADIFYTKVNNPERFGCIKWIIPEEQIMEIIEKPAEAPSNDAVIGLYAFPPSIFRDVLPFLKESARGELEITDVNNYYLKHDKLTALKFDGFWSDAGTIESLYSAGEYARNKELMEKNG